MINDLSFISNQNFLFTQLSHGVIAVKSYNINGEFALSFVLRTFTKMLFDLISDKLEIKIYLQILQKAADADLINVRIVEIEGVESFPTQVDIDVMKSSQMLDD